MAHEIFTDGWAREWGEQLAASPAYKEAAKTWEWPLILGVDADPSLGIAENRMVYLDLYHGDCREARGATKEDMDATPFIITADPYTWVQVLEGKLESISGIMRGKLRLVKGNMGTLAGYVLAAQELVKAATKIDSVYPEGLQ